MLQGQREARLDGTTQLVVVPTVVGSSLAVASCAFFLLVTRHQALWS